MSTLQARITATASGSSVSANSRCSRVAKSCRRSLAYPSARCSVFSRLGESIGHLLLFHRALQRMLVAPGEIDDLAHLCLRDFIGIHAAHTHSLAVDMQHNVGGFVMVLAEKPFEHDDHEFHRRIVVVEQKHLVHRGLLCLRLGLDDYPDLLVVVVAPVAAAHSVVTAGAWNPSKLRWRS